MKHSYQLRLDIVNALAKRECVYALSADCAIGLTLSDSFWQIWVGHLLNGSRIALKYLIWKERKESDQR